MSYISYGRSIQQQIVKAAQRMHAVTPSLRAEGMEFLKLAKDWLHIGDFEMAERALTNALAIFEPPPWPQLSGDDFCRWK
jgi:hypothetical protein